MKKSGFMLMVTLGFILFGAAVVCAAGDATVGPDAISYFKWIAIVTGFGMPLAAFGASLAQGNAAKAGCEGVARNPDASGKIITTLMISLAMIESLAIYALVIELILLYANPVLKYVIGGA